MSTKNPEKMIEIPLIRLSADETRAIMRAAISPRPTNDYYGCRGLVDLGIMRLVEVKPENHVGARRECWKAIREAATRQDRDAIQSEFSKLRSFDEQKRKNKEGYVLTDLGKQVARGVRVSLSSQWTAPQK